MPNRNPTRESAVLVHLARWSNLTGESSTGRFIATAVAGEDELEEFRALAGSAGIDVVAVVSARAEIGDPRYLVGAGKAEEIGSVVQAAGAGLALFDHSLTPSQERNLERLLGCRVADRTRLILDIFAKRARTYEGKLQVELAQLQHLSTRLVRGWSHLERQRGGIGLRGPGETQLETDRRLVKRRMRQLRDQLAGVKRQRGLRTRARRKAELPTVLLIGYTNAGKSTLFNALTGTSAYAAEVLFATLDPTLRRCVLPGAGAVIFGDTVGFIRALPHELVAAFRATLEEMREADLLVHVIDASAPQDLRALRADEVLAVVSAIGAEHVPCIEAYNKIDRILFRPQPLRDHEAAACRRVFVSAKTGQGVDRLEQLIAEQLQGQPIRLWLRLPPTAGRLRSRLYADRVVREERTATKGDWLLDVEIARARLERLCCAEGTTAHNFTCDDMPAPV